MGLQIGEIVPKKEITFEQLKGKILAVDAYNAIYQFLSSIRQPDGTPLMDSRYRITSHLSGLFYRNIALLSEGMKLIYVFDGEYNHLKARTHEIREEAKEGAKEKYKEAKDAEDIEAMGKYARGFTRLTKEMAEECKELLESLGIPIVQAPGEGEMQCAQLVKDKEAYAVSSQDYDAIVVGATRLIQNLTLARKRKTVSGYVEIFPEIISYEELLQSLDINGDQLICLAILVGTDFNPKGVKGIGPKKALALVKAKKYPIDIFKEVAHQIDFDWQKVFEIFKKPDVKSVKVSFPKLDAEKIKQILIEKHDFSQERVENTLAKLTEIKKKSAQKTLF